MTLAKLVAKTVPIIGDVTADEFVAYVARVSNPTNQDNKDTAPRLLRYLREHHHWSPFEMVSAVLEINTTRDIARQILRHRSFSFQEFSQRYANSANFDKPREARLQDNKDRQNSVEEGIEPATVTWWESEQHQLIEHASRVYDAAIDLGIAKEVARSVLPEGLTKSRLYMAGSLRSWIHYIDLRTANGTQKEHRLIAEACKKELLFHFPSAFGE